MNTKERIPAKADTSSEQSDAIVVSFGAEWYEHLLAQDFSVVIRKRVPGNTAFKWLYFHINSPVGAICARAAIKRIVSITKQEAIRKAKLINLSSDDITSYLGNRQHIGCYEIGTIEFPAKSITAAQINSELYYFPPQSFFIVSKNAKSIIDHMAGFRLRPKIQIAKQ